MQRARSRSEYLAMVREALDEVYDLRQSIEFDAESMGDAMGFVDMLDHQLQALQHSLEDGSYAHADCDLPFMALITRQHDEILPFKQLLKRINLTHREGLDEGGA